MTGPSMMDARRPPHQGLPTPSPTPAGPGAGTCRAQSYRIDDNVALNVMLTISR